MADYTLLQGDVRALLATLPERSVQCCVTSPPYWNLRDYGTAQWVGGDPDCDHQAPSRQGATGARSTRTFTANKPYQDACGKCGAQRIDQQIGLESTPQEFIAALVEVFALVHRALCDDGVLWVNIGDSYAREGGTTGGGNRALLHMEGRQARNTRLPADSTLKEKDLVGIPWMLAFALRDWGWYLRSDVIWAKPNPMPESVTDRPTRSHEYLFLLAKEQRYYYDAGAVREPHTGSSGADGVFTGSGGVNIGEWQPREKGGIARESFAMKDRQYNPVGRNKRDVWAVPSQPFPEAHFATFPEALIEPCVLAGSRPSDTVLDPFSGSATTGVVSLRHGRRYIGCELNPEYVAMARRRIEGSLNESNVLDRPKIHHIDGQIPLFEDQASPIAPACPAKGQLGKRTYSGFNERWAAKEAAP